MNIVLVLTFLLISSPMQAFVLNLLQEVQTLDQQIHEANKKNRAETYKFLHGLYQQHIACHFSSQEQQVTKLVIAESAQNALPAESLKLQDMVGLPQEVLQYVALLQQNNKRLRPRGMLMYGLPGTGKTTIARAIAQEVGFHHEYTTGSDFANKYIGEGSNTVRNLFARLRLMKPAVLVVDEIDGIFAKDVIDAHPEYKNIGEAFWTELSDPQNADIFVIGATNKYDQLDDASKRLGRFDYHVEVKRPSRTEREQLLRYYMRFYSANISDALITTLARQTEGFSGADIDGLVKKSAGLVKKATEDAARRGLTAAMTNQMENVFNQELEARREAVQRVLREQPYYFDIKTPTKRLTDLAGEQPEAIATVVQAFNNPENLARIGAHIPPGLLMYGPPGTGKSVTAEALAGSINAKFVYVIASTFNQKYVGEGAQHIKALFKQVRDYVQQNPGEKVVIFLDEIDAIGLRRGTDDHIEQGSTLVTLLHELDVIKDNPSIFVVAASNRFRYLDEALIRAGRMSKLLEIGLPNERMRDCILTKYLLSYRQNLITQNARGELQKAGDFADIVRRTEGFSSVDLEYLIKNAAVLAAHDARITIEHVRRAHTAMDVERKLRADRMETESEYNRKTAEETLKLARANLALAELQRVNAEEQLTIARQQRDTSVAQLAATRHQAAVNNASAAVGIGTSATTIGIAVGTAICPPAGIIAGALTLGAGVTAYGLSE